MATLREEWERDGWASEENAGVAICEWRRAGNQEGFAFQNFFFFFAETLASQIEAQLIFPILRQKKNLNMEVYSKEIANLSMPIPLHQGRKALDIQTTQVAIYPETTAANI